MTGTNAWMSPEIILGQPYTMLTDVYSYGCYAQELATGKTPFMDLSQPERIMAIKTRDPEPIGEDWS